ncbi:hypothetical protein [Granulicoccus sp. GXG6511]|uniref:hypothetical protein n=1 Tax=Granulicoccus sp. GXG6511 TaxID=3381351 RepID=UPI003D7EC52E
MAEVRKVTPGRGGLIAAAVEKAMGESVRPITPGGSPDPSKKGIPVPSAVETPITASSFLLNDAYVVFTDAPEDNSGDDQAVAGSGTAGPDANAVGGSPEAAGPDADRR